jgi:hypothetical protein
MNLKAVIIDIYLKSIVGDIQLNYSEISIWGRKANIENSILFGFEL